MNLIQDLDVCILAGGHGSRLAGVWEKAKCLVPVGAKGEPLIDVLLRKVFDLHPNRVWMLLGEDWRSEEVANYLGYPHFSLVESRTLSFNFAKPEGTAKALASIGRYISSSRVLVLNGDTLPLYNLGGFVHRAWWPFFDYPTAAWCLEQKVYAGAALLDQETLAEITESSEKDFSFYTNNFSRIYVDGFYDVGTPESFHNARLIKEPFL